ncbi:glutaredoxin family protein [Conexibacter sp. DBS9H8]|uniref:glutaredoxin family protein n=1 Tax=Conexibacter sp. DBS9H8 TaxID=2937801 RepID=UPI00200E1DB1|nr:glutaredoxin family protein [Conexibacter sp. DBS9H8]
MSRLTFYGRPGCHLCETALETVLRVQARYPFELEIVDIESDDRLLTRYLERIPVLVLDGQERFAFFVPEADLIDAIANLTPPAG